MSYKVLALNSNGDITYCSCSPEQRGYGRCNHIDHQKDGETPGQFIERVSNKMSVDKAKQSSTMQIKSSHSINELEINDFASQIDNIAGQKVTKENYKEVLKSLTPEQIAAITKIGFDASPQFSLPVSEENYDDENVKNKLYFANLPAYGIAGNMASMAQMFDKVGKSYTSYGEVDVEHSYVQGLTPSEYFARQFNARDAVIHKGVETSKPGYCIWENSIVEIKDPDNMQKTTKIPWKDINIGDTFIDDSQVVGLAEWQMKPCYEIKIHNSDKIVVSYDHLMFGQIIMNNIPITNLEKSAKARKNIGESDESWICAEDCYEFFNLGAKIILNDINDIEYIKPFESLIPQRVRCITSSTGFYETNGIISHNSFMINQKIVVYREMEENNEL